MERYTTKNGVRDGTYQKWYLNGQIGKQSHSEPPVNNNPNQKSQWKRTYCDKTPTTTTTA